MRKFLISAAMIGVFAGLAPAFAQEDREHHDRGAGQLHNELRGGGEPRGGHHDGSQPQSSPPPQPALPVIPERSGPPRGEMRGREREPEDTMRGRRDGREGQPPPNLAQPNQPSPNVPDNAIRDRGRRFEPNHGERRFGPNNAMRGPTTQPTQPPPNPSDNTARAPDRRFGPNNEERRFEPNNAMRGPGRDFSGVRNFHRNFRAERRFLATPYMRPRGFYEHRWGWGEVLPPLFWAPQYWIVDFEDYDLPPPPFGTVWVRVGDDALLIDQDSGMVIEVAYGVFY